jgi:HemY protein
MLRILAFLLVVLALALGFGWLQDHPGTIALTWQGVLPPGSDSVTLQVWTFIVLQLALLFLVVLTVWVVRSFFKAPNRIGRYFSTRRRDKGYGALSAGIVAAGAGDAVLARQMTKRSQKLLTGRREPLVQFLDAQTAMIEGDHDRARSAFETMEREPETRLLALRGLFLEAERLGDDAAARSYAERAVRIAPHVPWAGGAVLEAKSIEGDFDGALAILEAQRNARLIEKQESARLRAVLLTAKAMSIAERDPNGAKLAATEAQKLAPDLTPAAVTAAAALFRLGDLKRGTKVLEKAWTEAPHPDLAVAYVQARPGDSVADRLKRAKVLQDLRPNHVESSLAVAHAALDARDFTLARTEALAASRMEPREGIFLLLADIEEAETGSVGKVREWLGRAIRAPRDPAWTADGYVSESWAPVSPVTGRLDAFRWKTPGQRIDAQGMVIEAPADQPESIGPAETPPAARLDTASAATPATSPTAEGADIAPPPGPPAANGWTDQENGVQTSDAQTPGVETIPPGKTSANGESRLRLF